MKQYKLTALLLACILLLGVLPSCAPKPQSHYYAHAYTYAYAQPISRSQPQPISFSQPVSFS